MMMGEGTFNAAGTQTTVLQAREDSLLQATRSPADAAKIDKSSKEFEAVLLGNWLQQVEQSFATIPGSDGDDDPGRSQMLSMGVQSLASAMAESQAFGIGKMIARAMHHMLDQANTQLPGSS